MPSEPSLLPSLYSYRRCPYAMRARMALLQADHRFRVFEVSLRDKPATMLAASPKGTVPVLLLSDGRVLDESWDIMRWAWSSDDAGGWWARAQSAPNLHLLRINDGDFKRSLDRYKYPDRHPDQARPRETLRGDAVAQLLRPLEHRLQRERFLGGATPCATDLAIFPFVRQFAGVEPAWFQDLDVPAVQAWLAGWLEAPLFAACMEKQPPQCWVEVAPASQ